MGYYKDRIKGSNLRPYLHKISVLSTIASFVIGGIIYYGSPGMQRLGQLMEEGAFDDSPERRRIKEQWHFQFDYGTPLRSKETLKKVADIYDDQEFRDV